MREQNIRSMSACISLLTSARTDVDTARKILKEVPFDFVLLRPSLRVCVEPAASREEGAISDYVMVKNFNLARFEEGTFEPICDHNLDSASAESLLVRSKFSLLQFS